MSLSDSARKYCVKNAELIEKGQLQHPELKKAEKTKSGSGFGSIHDSKKKFQRSIAQSLMMLRNRQEFLLTIDLFNNLDKQLITSLAKTFQLVTFAPKEHLMLQGTEGLAFYVIFSGEVKVYVEFDKDGSDDDDFVCSRTIRIANSGNWLGEGSLLNNSPRTASVQAINDVVALRLNKEDFNELLKPTLSIKVQQQIERRKFECERNLLHLILSDPEGLHCFTKFLESVYCSEIICFYLAYQEYKKIDATDLAALNEKAKDIFDNFISVDATKQINTTYDMREEFEKSIKLKTCAPDIFESIAHAMRKDMNQDLLPRFLATSFYDAYAEQKFSPPSKPSQKSGFCVIS